MFLFKTISTVVPTSTSCDTIHLIVVLSLVFTRVRVGEVSRKGLCRVDGVKTIVEECPVGFTRQKLRQDRTSPVSLSRTVDGTW